jgi:putative ubiquitin-RnfH superfamily antitoxin RatB of RatAB toxin-antitoxin module
MGAKGMLRVEVVHALRDRQFACILEVDAGTTVGQAIEQSGVLSQLPGIDPARVTAGVFGKVVAPDIPLRDGDRVEIYRPLIANPKLARRERAQRAARRPRRG